MLAPAERRRSRSQPRASVGAQSGDIRGGHDGEVEILRDVLGHAVEAVDPGGAHRASLGLLLPVHEVIDHQRAIGPGEEFAEAHGAHGPITGGEVARALLKLVVLNGRALRQMAAQLGHAFALAHQLDFSEAKLLALGKVLGRFISQIGLPKRSVNHCVYHSLVSPRVILSLPAKEKQPGVTRVRLQRLGL